ncbi:cytochrome-c oxidase, cbb3-type subunit III [Arenibaculum sp.]|uniref:cytochrome-c oxidase, cbb3-type subunit III n=1 Tax=Arenibaculum sp. TaxID=2865862 RepID=UPI002E12D3A4|nr:cytochrome-c oxidase, cbb3-type subunit III [Arenibaculum sp.]
MPTKIEKDAVSGVGSTRDAVSGATKDAVTGVGTTGHEWDGIEELNNPLPKWWLYVFYATIVWSIGYWVLYPAWPTGSGYTAGLLGYDQRQVLAGDVAAAREAQAGLRARIQEASLDEIEGDADLLNFAITGGRFAFAENCAGCHGAGGAGAEGYPALADDDWLWGGTVDDIALTIAHGIRSGTDEARFSQMPRFGADGILDRAQISAVADHVLSLSAPSAATGGDAPGAAIYAENCAACHGDAGEGSREMGAPRFDDLIWLYGGDKAAVVESISNARFGVMPAWAQRLDPVTIKQLSVYVHTLGGGER